MTWNFNITRGSLKHTILCNYKWRKQAIVADNTIPHASVSELDNIFFKELEVVHFSWCWLWQDYVVIEWSGSRLPWQEPEATDLFHSPLCAASDELGDLNERKLSSSNHYGGQIPYPPCGWSVPLLDLRHLSTPTRHSIIGTNFLSFNSIQDPELKPAP